MALLLRPGDPLPALPSPHGNLDLSGHRGVFWLLAVGADAAALPPLKLQVHALPADAAHAAAARRLGADFSADVPQPLLILVDPALTVVASWAGAPLAELAARAVAAAEALASGRTVA